MYVLFLLLLLFHAGAGAFGCFPWPRLQQGAADAPVGHGGSYPKCVVLCFLASTCVVGGIMVHPKGAVPIGVNKSESQRAARLIGAFPLHMRGIRRNATTNAIQLDDEGSSDGRFASGVLPGPPRPQNPCPRS